MRAPQHAGAARLARSLNPDQLKLAAYMALPVKLRPPQEQIERELGVSHTTLWKWRKDPEFEAVRRELVRAYFVEYVPNVVQAMYERATGFGKDAVSAARLFLEFVKELDTAESKTKSVVVVLTKEEVLQRMEEIAAKTSDGHGVIDAHAEDQLEAIVVPEVEAPTTFDPQQDKEDEFDHEADMM